MSPAWAAEAARMADRYREAHSLSLDEETARERVIEPSLASFADHLRRLADE